MKGKIISAIVGALGGYLTRGYVSKLTKNIFVEKREYAQEIAATKADSHNYEIEIDRFKSLIRAKEFVRTHTDLPHLKIVKDASAYNASYHVRSGRYNKWMEAKKAMQDLTQSLPYLEPTIIRIERRIQEVKC